MKKMRIFVLGLVALVGAAMGSCQNNTDPGPVQWAGVVRSNLDGTFSDAAGTQLVPTTATFGTYSMAYIVCQLNPTVSTDTKARSITLLAEPMGIDGNDYLIDRPGAEGDVVSNAAVCDLLATDGFTAYTPAFFDAKTLVVPVMFFVKNETSPEALRAEIARHSFPLVCYMAPIQSGDLVLKLYVRHIINGDVSTPRTGTTYGELRAYSLTNALQVFRSRSGNEKPTQVVLCFEQNLLSDRLGEGATEKTVELAYKF